MCQATPPAGSNPTSRGAGNTFGSSPSSPGIPEAPADPTARGAGNTFGSTSAPDPSNNYGAPAGANAGLAASQAREGDSFGTQSFAQQGFSGVGTPTPTQAPGTTSSGPWTPSEGYTGLPGFNPTPTSIPGIVAPRMMDTGPLFGSQITPTPTQAPGTTSSGPWTPSEGYTGLPGFNPTPTSIPTTTEGADPFILRDQMYGLNPTPVDNVSNALMRRYRSYYNR